MRTLKTDYQAYNALAAQAKQDCPVARAFAQKQAKLMQDRIASLSFADRLKAML